MSMPTLPAVVSYLQSFDELVFDRERERRRDLVRAAGKRVVRVYTVHELASVVPSQVREAFDIENERHGGVSSPERGPRDPDEPHACFPCQQCGYCAACEGYNPDATPDDHVIVIADETTHDVLYQGLARNAPPADDWIDAEDLLEAVVETVKPRYEGLPDSLVDVLDMWVSDYPEEAAALLAAGS